MLNADPLYRGIKLNANDQDLSKSLLFVDDTCCAISCTEDLNQIEENVKIYERASGAKVNVQKTELLPFSNSHIDPSSTNFKTLDPLTKVRYLGAPIGNKLDINNIWNPIIDSITTTTSIASHRNLSMQCRRRTVKTYMISRIRYMLNFVHLPSDTEQCLNKLIQNFVIAETHAPVSREIMEFRPEFGGNIKHVRESYDLKMIQDLIYLGTIFSNHFSLFSVDLEILTEKTIELKHNIEPRLLKAIKTFRRYDGKNMESQTTDRIKQQSIRFTRCKTLDKIAVSSHSR